MEANLVTLYFEEQNDNSICILIKLQLMKAGPVSSGIRLVLELIGNVKVMKSDTKAINILILLVR